MYVIGIHGKARSGKDTVGAMIRDLFGFENSEMTAFAEPLKKMLSMGLGIHPVFLYGADKENEHVTGFDCSPRHMMQTLGTEWGRKLIHPDIWVKALHNSIKLNDHPVVIITDVRFQNEAEYVRKHGCLIHVVGRGGIDSGHISESGVDVDLNSGDLVIENDGTIEQLRDKVQILFDLGRLSK